MRVYFRARVSAAPLKRAASGCVPGALRFYFRARVSAAPLKPPCVMTAMINWLGFPRSRERGPVEAFASKTNLAAS